jgi:hypothetical protein
MGSWHGGRTGDGPGSEKMAAMEMACLNRGMVGGSRVPWTGPQRTRRGRINTDVQHILLLPTGLAVGLGQEVACPTAYADSPQKTGPPLLRWGFGKLGGRPESNLANMY